MSTEVQPQRPHSDQPPGPKQGPGVLHSGVVEVIRPRFTGAERADLYGVENPVPVEKHEEDLSLSVPKSTGYRWVPNLSTDVDFAVLLDALEETSPTHQACIRAKAFYAVGERFMVRQGADADTIVFGTEDPDAEAVVAPRDQEALLAMARRLNYQYGLKELFRLGAKEYLKQGNVWVELRRAASGGARAFEAEVHSAQHCLLEHDKDGALTGYVLVSPSWEQAYLDQHQPARVPLMQTGWEVQDGVERVMLHVMDRKPARRHYGVPSSLAGRLDAQNEFRSAEHNFWNFENGFSARTILQFVKAQNMTNAGARKFVDKLKEAFSGQSAERLFVQIVESEAALARVDNLSDQFQGDFGDLREDSRRAIIRAHNWWEILVGNPTAGKLGETKEFLDTYRLAMSTVIKPLRSTLVRELLMPVVHEYLTWMVGEAERDWRLEPVMRDPISVAASIDAELVTSVSEAREALGLEGDLEGDPASRNRTTRRGGSVAAEAPVEPAAPVAAKKRSGWRRLLP